MARIALALAMLTCLTLAATAQTTQAPGVIPSTMSADSNIEEDGVFRARGNVRIVIGATVITADEADIRRSTGYRMRDVELRGNVHMTYQLTHD